MNRRKKNSKVINMTEARERRKEKRALQKSRGGAKRTSRIFAYRKLCIVALLLLLVLSSAYAVRIAALKAGETHAAAELEAALEEKTRLEDELAHIDDPAYIEQQARTRLRMIKPGEIYYVLPERDAGESGAAADEKADAE
jgi:cell division protein FtsB